MSVKIRLSKTGKTHQVSYRVVVQDTRTKRDGKFLEILGYYNPHLKEKNLEFKKDRFAFWTSKGAKPTVSLANLIEGKTKKTKKESKSKEQK